MYLDYSYLTQLNFGGLHNYKKIPHVDLNISQIEEKFDVKIDIDECQMEEIDVDKKYIINVIHYLLDSRLYPNLKVIGYCGYW